MDDPQKLGTIRTTSIVPVDLNALMFKMEKLLAKASQDAGDTASATTYDALATARQKAIEKHLWNDKEGWYADYDLKSKKVRNQLTAAALFPLFVKAAAQDRADKVAAAASARLLKPGGISTTTDQQRAAVGCTKRLGTIAVGRDGRVAELRARQGGDGCDLALPEKCSAYLRSRAETG
jgi:neutral trehalase